jgi:hypothetical protein
VYDSPSYSCCQSMTLRHAAGRSLNSSAFHYRVNISQQQHAQQLHTDETTRHPGGRAAAAALHLPKHREEEPQHRAQGQPHTRNVQSSLALARRGRWEGEGSGRMLTQFTGPDGRERGWSIGYRRGGVDDAVTCLHDRLDVRAAAETRVIRAV